MRRLVIPTLLGPAALAAGCGDTLAQEKFVAPQASTARASGNVLTGRVTRLTGGTTNLARFRGKVVLVVNTASECGFTPQFKGLEALYRAKRGRGLVLLGFPSNDFNQELDSDKKVSSFCKANFGVTFPMFSRTKVTGGGASPLYKRLRAAAGQPQWNFNKYLLDRHGRVVKHYPSTTEPDAPVLTKRIDALLRRH